MRLEATAFLLAIGVAANAQESLPSITVAGLTIERGMPEEAVRSELAYPYDIQCEEDSGTGDTRYCQISSEEQDSVGEVFIKDGRVVSANRVLEIATGKHGGLRTLYGLLNELTNGMETCAIVSSRADQIMLALPEKKVELSLKRRQGEDYLAIREGLRFNPTPKLTLDDCWPGATASGPNPDLEESIPEPTQLKVLTSRSDSRILWSQNVGAMQSPTSRARVTAMEMQSADGERLQGVRIELTDGTGADTIYIDRNQISGFLAELTLVEPPFPPCEAGVCTHGIARCRPSQSVPQAYCPGYYTAPELDGGLILSTSRHSFRFPSQRPSTFAELISSAMERLNRRGVPSR